MVLPWQNPDVTITQLHQLIHRPLLMCPVATQTALLEALTAEELGPEYINSSHRALVTGHVMLNYLTQFLI